MRSAISAALIVVALAFQAPLHGGDEPGHSEHGSAFDTGLRQRPMKGTGVT